MVTDINKLLLLAQIAKLFFPSDLISQASCLIRMKSNLDNDTFDYFLSNINQGRYYVFTINTVRHDALKMVTIITNSYIDLITGSKGTGGFTVPLSLYTGGKWAEIFQANDPPMNLMSSRIVNNLSTFLVYSPRSSSYGITYVPTNPTSGGNTGGTGGNTGGTGGGGTVIVNPPAKEPIITKTDLPVNNETDITKFLLPAAAVIAIYLLLK